MKIKCDRCGYIWDTLSKLFFVTCPSCRKSVQIRDIPDEKEMEKK